MASMNLVVLMGNLTRDPELKFIPSGQAVCNFSIATNRKWKSANGEWKEDVSYIKIVVWGKSGEACGEYLKKGSACLVEGRLQSRSWETDKGEKRSTLEVMAQSVKFIGSRRENSGQAEHEPGTETAIGDGGSDDDIPF